MKKEKHIPTIIGLVLLFSALFGGVYFINKQTNFLTKASGDCQPVNLQITNLTHNSADFSFTTLSDCLSSLNINDRTIEDIRSVVAPPVAPSKIHYFQINGLSPSTSYNFFIISNGQKITADTYQFNTPAKPKNPVSPSNLAWGKVLNPDLSPASGTIVYLNLPGASPLSSYVTSNGNWNISLASSFKDDQTDWFALPNIAVDEEIVVISENEITTQITNNSSQNNPVPDIIIGQNRFSSSVLEIPTENQTGSFGSVNQVISTNNLDILNPKDNESLTTNMPLFFGNAPPNSKIVIKVESPVTLNGEINANDLGSWQWTPPQGLTPGEHTITASVQNPQTGLWETVSRKFIILATDGSPQFVASGSATINPSPTLTITPAPVIPTITPTPIPTTFASTPIPTTFIPTSIPTLIQPSPTVIRSAHPSVSGTPPITGNPLPTSSLIFFGLILIVLSYKLLVASTKKIF